MPTLRKRATDYAEQILAKPSGKVRVALKQGKGGVTLLHKGRALTRCPMNRSGMRAAVFMAKALGVKIPPLGEKIETYVSTGVLWRAVSISSLDYRKEESFILLERLLEEAAMMLHGSENDKD